MKMILKGTSILLLSAIGVLFFSCGEDVEKGTSQVDVNMKATTTLSTISGSSGRVTNTGFTFLEALVGVTEIELETLEEATMEDQSGDQEEEDSNEIEFEGNFIVDLLTGTSTPDFGLASLPTGIYEEIEIEMDPILEDGNTIFILFEYTPDVVGAEKMTIEFSSARELEFELESENGFQLDGINIDQILILFDLDLLIAGIDLANATPNEDGVIRITESSNQALFEQITTNLDHVLEAGEDDDDDGEFDDDEEDESDDD